MLAPLLAQVDVPRCAKLFDEPHDVGTPLFGDLFLDLFGDLFLDLFSDLFLDLFGARRLWSNWPRSGAAVGWVLANGGGHLSSWAAFAGSFAF